MRIVREQQNLRGGGEHEQHANERFLRFRSLALRPREQQCTEQCRDDGRNLCGPAFRTETHRVCGDYAEPGHLRNREIDEYDAAREHLLTQWHMREDDEQARDERGPENAHLSGDITHFSAPSSRATVSSNRPNRSFAAGVPPTE